TPPCKLAREVKRPPPALAIGLKPAPTSWLALSRAVFLLARLGVVLPPGRPVSLLPRPLPPGGVPVPPPAGGCPPADPLEEPPADEPEPNRAPGKTGASPLLPPEVEVPPPPAAPPVLAGSWA